MKIVIIGSNAAGMTFAAKYKRNNPEHEVIAFEKRDYVSFGGCGLPYYAGQYFESKKMMIARSVNKTIASGIDLRINHEVINIDFKNKSITVNHLGNIFEQEYDKLFISTGAKPIVPNFGDYNQNSVTTLVSMADGEKLRALLADESKENIVIIGGGFIGLEVMDSAHHLGKNVTVIERESNIMARQFSSELTEIVMNEIKDSGINLMTNTSVEQIDNRKDGYTIKTNNGAVEADAIIIAIGFRPNTSFIDLEKMPNGALITDLHGQTSQVDVYAAGDCATIYNKILDKQVYLPLATVANKQGRNIADYMSGKLNGFKGMLSSSCLQVLDFEMACTGVNEIEAAENGISVKAVFIKDKNQTGYYPGQEDIYVKLVYRENDNVIIGAQMIGKKGVVGRIDALAVAIHSELTTEELGYIDFCYAPPFARTWDVMNVAGNVAK